MINYTQVVDTLKDYLLIVMFIIFKLRKERGEDHYPENGGLRLLGRVHKLQENVKYKLNER